jgi:Outer membrane protein beta-barrel domain
MKRLTLLLATAIICLSATAQEEKKDTIRIGGMIIVKDGKKNGKNKDFKVTKNNSPKKRSNISTNWWILDLGFSNYEDKTNYATAGSYLVNRPGSPAIGKDDFKLRTGKSINVNIWVFMQRLNLIKHHVNLKYGLGVELNNYRYKSAANLSYKEGGTIPYSGGMQTSAPFIFRDSISFSKNKLAADYITVPMMLNFSSHASQKKGVSLSVGVSAGYLYAQRNKQKSNERGKWKNKGDYDLERFKLSYIAELGLGPMRLYGSYSPESMYEKSLDIRPYTVGLRFSNW